MKNMPANKPESQKQRGNFLRALLFSSQIGGTVISCLFIGVFLGKFLDQRLDTSPWLLLAFSLLGAAAAFKLLLNYGTKNN